MDEDMTPDQASLFPKSVGDRLRDAREALGLSLADVASRTRVPLRHLEAIEQSRYDTMPSPTYAIGFAKTYARAVGLDEKQIANDLRQSPQMPLSPASTFEEYEPADPRRVPSRGIAGIAGVIAVILVVVVAIWYGTSLFRGGESTPAPDASATVAAAPEATPTPAPVTGGQVSLMATDSVWLRVYDGTGKTLFEKTMQAGERYDVPADANNPMINIGRPDKLQITINGSAIPALGDGSRAIKDVGVSAAALQARASGQPLPGAAPTPAASSAPVAAATPKPAPSASATSKSRSELPPAFRTTSPAPTPSAAPRATTPDAVPTPAAAPTAAP